MRVRGAALAAATVLLLAAAPARAQTEYTGLDDEVVVASPEWGNWEIFALGPYQPRAIRDVGNASLANPPLRDLASDKGPLLSTELDVTVWRIPYVGPLQAGVRAGWAKYEGPALDNNEQPTGEKSKVMMFPVTPQAVLRVDVLARELNIPLVFAGKIGLQVIPWFEKKGGVKEGSDIELGLRWGAQIALELDFLEPRAARRLDEEWGINHSLIFAEVFGSTADFFGDSLAWTMGLGFAF